MAVPAIEGRDLYRFFHTDDEEVLALRGVSITAEPGEIVAVTGPSGSGKSTLLLCLAGLDEPDGGRVDVDGARMTRRSEQERARLRAERVGVLFQSGNLLEHLIVADNVRLARRLAGRAPGDVVGLLDDLGIGDRAAVRPSTLSGGEAARAGLAVAVANDPAVVLADEPTGELDAATEQIVIDLLRRRAATGTAVVVATHSAAVAGAADRQVHLADGTVVA